MNISKNVKKVIVTALTLVLLMSSIPSFAAETRYKDVPREHWAYSYIEDMSELKFLFGYPEDNTFKPSGDLTFLESMSALSRFVNLSPVEEKRAMEEYSSLLKELKTSIPWEVQGLSIALYSDIITEAQLREASKSGIFNRPISREVIAEFLAKAMNLEGKIEEKLVRKELPFKDLNEINEYRVEYVDILLDVGVLSPEGKGEGKFEPKSTLTRAEMSTLLSKAYYYLQKNPIVIVPETPKAEIETVQGRIKEVEEQIGRRKITIANGEEYILETGAELEIDGKEASHSSLRSGQEVEMKIKSGTRDILSMKVESVIEEDLEGLIKALNLSTNKLTLEYKDENKVTSKELDLDKNVKVILNNKDAELSELRVGDLIKLKIKNNLIVDIEARSKNEKQEGIITEISPIGNEENEEYYITIVDDKENTHKFFANKDTYIYRNNSKAKIEDLKLKDEAYIISEYDLINEDYIAKDIEANIVKKNIKGYVVAVITRYNENTKVVIENNESEKEEIYELTKDASIRIDNSSVSALPANTGYYVEMKIEGDVIKEINIDKSSSETSFIGSVTDYDRNNKTIEVTIDRLGFEKARVMNVYVDKDTEILSKDYDRKLDLKDIYVGYRVNIIGTYQGANFVADTIQLR